MKASHITEPRPFDQPRMFRRIADAALAAVLLSSPSEAQIPTGNILGAGKDSQGG